MRLRKTIINITKSSIHSVKSYGGFLAFYRKVLSVSRNEGLNALTGKMRQLARQPNSLSYSDWIERFDTITDKEREYIADMIERLPLKPLISVIMPVYNPEPKWLISAINSVINQLYGNWELCIADDASSDGKSREILQGYANGDQRIKLTFRKQNGHISDASNSALELASGEWCALMDQDDLISEDALYWVAKEINRHPDAKLLYSDEDKIGSDGCRTGAYFKCDWNQDLFYSHNLISHLGVYKAELIHKLGFRKGYEGSQDYDLALRMIEHIDTSQIHHIPKVLYHWRMHNNSAALSISNKPYAYVSAQKALQEHFDRRNIKCNVTSAKASYRVCYRLPKSPPLVSLITIATGQYSLIKKCVHSVLSKTDYDNFELIIVDNGANGLKTIKYLNRLKSYPRVRIIQGETSANFSALINSAVGMCKGELVGLLNSDLEVISPCWLTEMVGLAMQPRVGAVGAKLLYPNNTIQHAGIILGIGGIAGNSHRGIDVTNHGYAGRAALISGVSAVSGACLVIRKELYDAVGGLNESELAEAYSDIDFCLKVRQAGFDNVWTPYALLYHRKFRSSSSQDAANEQDRFALEMQYMNDKWGHLLSNDPAYSPNLTLDSEDFSLRLHDNHRLGNKR